MAGYQTHITVSGLLGVGYGLAASWVMGFNGIDGSLAGCFTGIAGMLPDLDSESGRPVREVFGVTAALSPLLLHQQLKAWGGSDDGAMLLSVLLYISVRYGASTILGLVSVHRGMFHSVPALIIASEVAFLGYRGHSNSTRLLMAAGVAIGFISHLILDEIYSVQWNGMKVKLKSSAGTAMKFVGKDVASNVFCYGLLFTLSYGVLTETGMINPATTTVPEVPPNALQMTQKPPLPATETRRR